MQYLFLFCPHTYFFSHTKTKRFVKLHIHLTYNERFDMSLKLDHHKVNVFLKNTQISELSVDLAGRCDYEAYEWVCYHNSDHLNQHKTVNTGTSVTKPGGKLCNLGTSISLLNTASMV